MADRVAVGAGEAVARRFDRQRYRVLVLVRHRPFALGERRETRVGPFVGFDDSCALQSEAWDMGAKTGNSNHAESLPAAAFLSAVGINLPEVGEHHEWARELGIR